MVASLMTPSPKTRLNSSGARSCSSTCSTATLSVVAKMAPSARQSCAHASKVVRFDLRLEMFVGFKPSARQSLGLKLPDHYFKAASMPRVMQSMREWAMTCA